MKMQLTPLLVTTFIDMLINSSTFVKYKNNFKMGVELIIYIYIYIQQWVGPMPLNQRIGGGMGTECTIWYVWFVINVLFSYFPCCLVGYLVGPLGNNLATLS
jgi:hypothetical protein